MSLKLLRDEVNEEGLSSVQIDEIQTALPQVIEVSIYLHKLEFLDVKQDQISSTISQIFSDKSETFACFLTCNQKEDANLHDQIMTKLKARSDSLDEQDMNSVLDELESQIRPDSQKDQEQPMLKYNCDSFSAALHLKDQFEACGEYSATIHFEASMSTDAPAFEPSVS